MQLLDCSLERESCELLAGNALSCWGMGAPAPNGWLDRAHKRVFRWSRMTGALGVGSNVARG